MKAKVCDKSKFVSVKNIIQVSG